ncbi:LTA synthase family protein [Pseudothermotoga thermarum]|uniref:Sulfatase n=1 Tax=Pseudothermotoga thermarum DSM 5069 TaxID=688269 RepID=F7YW53_9THEM|nr:LTA synthase family protein [Pseudothermotoga thermarum]AEH50542.1 sulfatase [Pseudothermotoga thermarum DSM 5069]
MSFGYTTLFLTISLAKTFVFYAFLPRFFNITMFVSTVFWCVLFYLIFSHLLKGKEYVLYCIISVAIVVDFLYFKNFGNMPSLRHLSLLPQLGKVRSSVKHSVDFACLFFLADLAPLWFLDRRRYKKFVKNSPHIIRKDLLLLIFMCLGFAWLPLIVEKPKPNQVFARYGLIAYHSYDVVWSIFGRDQKSLELVIFERFEQGKRYRGVAKGKNLIVIQLESFQSFLIGFHYNDQEVTPNLNRIVSQSIYFENYYQQAGCGNTADAEFVSLTSLHVPGNEVAYEVYADKTLEALPAILRNHGYETIAFHGNTGWFWNRKKIYPNLGFDKFYSLEELNNDEIFGLGLSDLSLYKQAIEIIKRSNKPFFAFIVTLSSHTPFLIPEQYKMLTLDHKHEGTIFGNYLQSVHYADYALGWFIEELKKEGIYENSIIVLYGDHAGIQPFVKENAEIMKEVLGKEYDYAEAFRVPLVIHIPKLSLNLRVQTIGGQVDFLPTMLNLLGIDADQSKMVGKDLLNCSESFVALRYQVPDGSFIDERRYFMVSPDGFLQNSFAYDRILEKPLPYYECLDGYKKAIQQIELSRAILKEHR